MAGKSERSLLVDGKPLDDKAGRWMVVWDTGLSDSGEPRISVSDRMAGPGSVAPSRAVFQGSPDWGIQVLVSDHDLKGNPGGYGQREKNRVALMQRLRVGRVVELGVKSRAGTLSQRGIVSSGVSVDERNFENAIVSFTVRLLDGQWSRGAWSVQSLDVDGSVRSLKGGSASARCAWRFPAGRSVVVSQEGRVVLDWHGSVPAGRVLVVDGWDWWLADADATEWWEPTVKGSALNLDQHDPLWPDSKGAYQVTVEIDGRPVEPGTVWTRGRVQWL